MLSPVDLSDIVTENNNCIAGKVGLTGYFLFLS